MHLTRRDFGIGVTAGLLVASSEAALAAATPDIPARWDLSPIFADDGAWEAERQRAQAELPDVARLKGTLGGGAANLATALQRVSDLRRAFLRLSTYAQLRNDADQRSPAGQMLRQKSGDFQQALDAATAWMDAEIVALGRERIGQMVAGDPRLAHQRQTLDETFRQAPHSGSAAADLFASAGPLNDGPRALQRNLIATAIPTPTMQLSNGATVALDRRAFSRVAETGSREERKRAYDAYWAGYAKLEGAFGLTLTMAIEGAVLSARTRGFASSRDAALFGLALPDAVYPTMLEEVHRGLPLLQRFYRLRRRALGTPDLHEYDLAVPLAASVRKFDLATMRSLLLGAVEPLGNDYAETLARATLGGWMDAYPRPGKVPGGYTSVGAYGAHPYVLLNLTDDYDGARAFAHEWGHAMHGVLASAAQPFDTFYAPPFIQEIASTCHEQLLIRRMLANARAPQERLFYLFQQLQTFETVFFRQALQAEFEAELHKRLEAGQTPDGASISALYLEIGRRYAGGELVLDPAYSAAWGRSIQFYDPFYTFQYVTALTGAVHFAGDILSGRSGARDRYLALLRVGGSLPGYVLLRDHGLDLASPDPYRVVLADMEIALSEAEQLVAARE